MNRVYINCTYPQILRKKGKYLTINQKSSYIKYTIYAQKSDSSTPANCQKKPDTKVLVLGYILDAKQRAVGTDSRG